MMSLSLEEPILTDGAGPYRFPHVSEDPILGCKDCVFPLVYLNYSRDWQLRPQETLACASSGRLLRPHVHSTLSTISFFELEQLRGSAGSQAICLLAAGELTVRRRREPTKSPIARFLFPRLALHLSPTANK